MLRVPVRILLLPLRVFFFIYMRLRAIHRELLLDVCIRSDYSEAPLSHGIWAYFKPAKDRFYLIALELQSVITAVRLGKLKLSRARFTFEANSLGWAQAWEIRQLITALREEKVKTYAYLLSDDRITMFMASACDYVACPESATFDLSPFTSESLFVQNLLNRLGVRPQFLSVGEFKSAAEIFTRTGMSKAARRQTEELIADIEKNFYDALGQKSPEFAAAGRRDLLSANEALQQKLIDAVSAYSEFKEFTEKEAKLKTADLFDAQNIARRRMYPLFNFKKTKKLALFVAEGNIIESSTSRPGTINWHDYEPLSDILRDGNFSAVLLRINSPGGSALVSQLLWREWMLATGRLRPQKQDHPSHETKDKKPAIPVFVSQGNVAASGGYYLSAIADHIFATPVTITGSIGVVGGKFNVAPLLTKWGVSLDRAPKKNAPPAFSPFADFAPAQKRALQRNMAEIYEQFLRDIATGRNTQVAKVKPHASGRVFSGAAAQKLGLTDAEGGICAALLAIRKQLNLAENETLQVEILPSVKESLFGRNMLPLGLKSLANLADFAKPGVYAIDTRFFL